MKNEQKVPNGIEIYAVKPNISLIRYICFWTDFSPWRVCPFDHMHSFYSSDYFCSRSQGFQSKHIPNPFLINRRSGSMILFKYFSHEVVYHAVYIFLPLVHVLQQDRPYLHQQLSSEDLWHDKKPRLSLKTLGDLRISFTT